MQTRLDSARPFRVLALDGGGIRGLYSATVLDALASHFATERGVTHLDVGKGFDLITGTSTGGLVACGLAFGSSPRDLIALFREIGPSLFRRPIPSSLLGFMGWSLGTLRTAANSDAPLRQALEKQFGTTTLLEVFQNRKIRLCIPSVNIRTARAWVFKTPHEPGLTRDRHFQLVDVCLSTSAAPIYLPLASIDDPNDKHHQLILADGGLWANNPVLVGLIEALSLAKKDQPIQILSVSTCPSPQGEIADRKTRHWGLLKWRGGTTALTLSLESQAFGYHYMASKLAEVLRQHGRDCDVVRIPHSSPSINQAPYVGLDRASSKAMAILSELGRADGDFDSAGAKLSTRDLAAVSEIFMSMPESGQQNENRRRGRRVVRGIDLGAGLVLRDQSPAGVCLMITGPAPNPGATFRWANDHAEPQCGTVRWVQQLEDNVALFGLQTIPEPRHPA